MLNLRNLKVTTGNKEILHGLDLSIGQGELHILMGPNGGGKSTLANYIAGHPDLVGTDGAMTWFGEDIVALAPEERAAKGIFLAFQHPSSIPGVSVSQFVRLSLHALAKARGEAALPQTAYLKELRQDLASLGLPPGFAARAVGDGMSGGEQKRLELLQLMALRPKLAILDEIDSGLDIDGIRLVGETIRNLHARGTSFLVITHYQRLLDELEADRVHIIKDGSIARSGDRSLAHEVELQGYGQL